MQIELARFVGFKGALRQPIAGCIAAQKRRTKALSLLFRRLQLDVCDKFHGSSIEELVRMINIGAALLPGMNAVGSARRT